MQRQRCRPAPRGPELARGAASRRGSSWTATISPGVQKPLARRRRRGTPAATGCRSSPSPRPSIVIDMPSACPAATRHGHTRTSSISTAHDPHSPSSQAFLDYPRLEALARHVEQALAPPHVVDLVDATIDRRRGPHRCASPSGSPHASQAAPARQHAEGVPRVAGGSSRRRGSARHGGHPLAERSASTPPSPPSRHGSSHRPSITSVISAQPRSPAPASPGRPHAGAGAPQAPRSHRRERRRRDDRCRVARADLLENCCGRHGGTRCSDRQRDRLIGLRQGGASDRRSSGRIPALGAARCGSFELDERRVAGGGGSTSPSGEAVPRLGPNSSSIADLRLSMVGDTIARRGARSVASRRSRCS